MEIMAACSNKSVGKDSRFAPQYRAHNHNIDVLECTKRTLHALSKIRARLRTSAKSELIFSCIQ